jgi:hypothetical protein
VVTVTPGAIFKLVNGPTGEDSNVSSDIDPRLLALASNAAAAAAELGLALLEPAPTSLPTNRMGDACAVPIARVLKTAAHPTVTRERHFM